MSGTLLRQLLLRPTGDSKQQQVEGWSPQRPPHTDPITSLSIGLNIGLIGDTRFGFVFSRSDYYYNVLRF